MVRRREPDTAAVLKGAETIDLREEGSHGGLLLHGFGDTPQTLALLARRLKKSGYSVFVPLLPGHGRNMEAFTRSRADECIAAARISLLELRSRSDGVSVAGLSIGGALAVLLAADTRDIAALVLIAPYLGMPRLLHAAAVTYWLWGGLAGGRDVQKPPSRHGPIRGEKNTAHVATSRRALFA